MLMIRCRELLAIYQEVDNDKENPSKFHYNSTARKILFSQLDISQELCDISQRMCRDFSASSHLTITMTS